MAIHLLGACLFQTCGKRSLKHSLPALTARYCCRFGFTYVSIEDLAKHCSVPVILKGVPRCVSEQHSGPRGVLLHAFQVSGLYSQEVQEAWW